ncbi:trypsin 3A1-like [Schistocerca piceifrons]|uniref:trypsin 3A1-like n=1 Tax=Schistocerca piceifrons TaxID=274613 RepID=UPI001F5E55C3|nr:trypsin 3A1-like [Schistocerca piceifrons]
MPWSRRGHGRIVNGNATTISEYPWNLSIQFLVRHECGASIISTTWAMSAGHCFYDDVTKMLLRAGSTTRESGGVVFNISRVVYHENFNSTSLDNDIVVVQPSEPFPLGPNIQPVALPADGYEAPAGLPVTATGWGLDQNFQRPEELLKVDLYVDQTSVCSKIFADILPVTDSMMCAGNIHKGVCFGDSGSPLVSGNMQVGIVSWGDEDCEYPLAMYTDVGYMRPWIRNITGV